jgi:hypothetical protein
MDWSIAANLVNAAAVAVGVVFAATQIRDYRKQRRRESMLELIRSFQNPAFARSLHRINSLPDDADLQTIHETLGLDAMDDVFLVGLTWESLGVLVYRGEITIELVEAFYSGMLTVTWRKLHRFAEQDRQRLQRQTVWEWFQWLAERMNEHEAKAPVIPAYVAKRNWRQ